MTKKYFFALASLFVLCLSCFNYAQAKEIDITRIDIDPSKPAYEESIRVYCEAYNPGLEFNSYDFEIIARPLSGFHRPIIKEINNIDIPAKTRLEIGYLKLDVDYNGEYEVECRGVDLEEDLGFGSSLIKYFDASEAHESRVPTVSIYTPVNEDVFAFRSSQSRKFKVKTYDPDGDLDKVIWTLKDANTGRVFQGDTDYISGYGTVVQESFDISSLLVGKYELIAKVFDEDKNNAQTKWIINVLDNQEFKVKIKNIPGGSDKVPLDHAYADLYDSLGNELTGHRKYSNYDGELSWYNLAPYIKFAYAVFVNYPYQDAISPFAEFWGFADEAVEPIGYYVFERKEPYINKIEIINDVTGQIIDAEDTLKPGTRLRFKAYSKQKVSKRNSKIRLVLKSFNRRFPDDTETVYDEATEFLEITNEQENVFDFAKTLIVPKTNSYKIAAEIFSIINELDGEALEYKTDSWEFIKAFNTASSVHDVAVDSLEISPPIYHAVEPGAVLDLSYLLSNKISLTEASQSPVFVARIWLEDEISNDPSGIELTRKFAVPMNPGAEVLETAKIQIPEQTVEGDYYIAVHAYALDNDIDLSNNISFIPLRVQELNTAASITTLVTPKGSKEVGKQLTSNVTIRNLSNYARTFCLEIVYKTEQYYGNNPEPVKELFLVQKQVTDLLPVGAFGNYSFKYRPQKSSWHHIDVNLWDSCDNTELVSLPQSEDPGHKLLDTRYIYRSHLVSEFSDYLFEDFSNDSFLDNFRISSPSEKFPGEKNAEPGKFKSELVDIVNDTNAKDGNSLALTVLAGKEGNNQEGGQIVSRKSYRYGNYRARIRMDLEDTVGGFFTYFSDPEDEINGNDLDEIDVEIVPYDKDNTGDPVHLISRDFANPHGTQPWSLQEHNQYDTNINDEGDYDYIYKNRDVDKYLDYHFEWREGCVHFYIGEHGGKMSKVFVADKYIPEEAGRIQFNHWTSLKPRVSGDNPGWGAGPPKSDSVMNVDWVQYDNAKITIDADNILVTDENDNPKSTFAPGEKFKITVFADNAGDAVPVQAILDVVSSLSMNERHTLYSSYKPGRTDSRTIENYKPDSWLGKGQRTAFVFVRTVPENAVEGDYDIRVSVRNGDNWRIIHDVIAGKDDGCCNYGKRTKRIEGLLKVKKPTL